MYRDPCWLGLLDYAPQSDISSGWSRERVKNRLAVRGTKGLGTWMERRKGVQRQKRDDRKRRFGIVVRGLRGLRGLEGLEGLGGCEGLRRALDEREVLRAEGR